MFVTLLTEKGNINLRLILISSYASATYPIVSGLVEVVVHQISIAGLAPIVGIVEPFTSSGSTATRTATKQGQFGVSAAPVAVRLPSPFTLVKLL